MVDAHALSRTFVTGDTRQVAIDRVQLCVDDGEFIAIFGPSGSGKSTLLGIIGGLDRGYEGRLSLNGQDLRGMSDRQLAHFRGARLGFVFQAFHLIDHLSVLENVMVPAMFTPIAKPNDAARSALERVGLADRAADKTANLSGGQRQRVAIARAIAHKPSLLLCDEPTGNLDDETARQIIEIFSQLNRIERTTVLCSTHDKRISQVATRIVQLRNGRIDASSHSPEPEGKRAH